MVSKNYFPPRIVDHGDHLMAAKFYLNIADEAWNEGVDSSVNLAIAHALTGILGVLCEGHLSVETEIENQ